MACVWCVRYWLSWKDFTLKHITRSEVKQGPLPHPLPYPHPHPVLSSLVSPVRLLPERGGGVSEERGRSRFSWSAGSEQRVSVSRGRENTLLAERQLVHSEGRKVRSHTPIERRQTLESPARLQPGFNAPSGRQAPVRTSYRF